MHDQRERAEEGSQFLNYPGGLTDNQDISAHLPTFNLGDLGEYCSQCCWMLDTCRRSNGSLMTLLDMQTIYVVCMCGG